MKAVKTTEKILAILADGQFHSGEQIGQRLGISRSAIWKSIHELSEKYQMKIESIIGKGYRLERPIDFLNAEKIMAQMTEENRAFLSGLEILNQIDSTNDYLMQKLKARNFGNRACFAEQQTQGKGRRGRIWISPFGHNIYHSLLWDFSKDPGEIRGLSLAIAVAVLEALHEYGLSKNLALKWPNDIYYANKKLAGILIEISAQANDSCQAIIGIGINTYIPNDEKEKIDQAFTSLEEIEHEPTQRNRLAGILLNHLLGSLRIFEKQGLSPFLKKWNQHDYLKNREIILKNQGKIIKGQMRGISENGELLLESNGQISALLSGEAQILKQGRS